MRMKTLVAGMVALTLAACGTSGPQYLVETPASDLRVRARVPTMVVRTVSLPSYAADEAIAFQAEDGSVQMMNKGLWADEPERATTLAITRHLNTMTSAKVAPDPWPLPQPAIGVLDIRVETFIATRQRSFRMSGQYFLGSETPDPIVPDDPDKDPIERPAPLSDKARNFDLQIPLTGPGPGAIATAQAAALKSLAEAIARDMAR
ncbi:PqiC family protein [Ponticoccus sp. (in: a-proteobacteria)]|uniref:PqiC family protein n=1 Tax=Ponticoccus sp. (in: a-proteobacteria) TaxID=1925025 RepID=UPI003AB499DE